jgi:hypothetical protein
MITRPSCMRTQPNPVPDASQETLKDFVMSSCANTGAIVSNFFRVWNASSRSALQTLLFLQKISGGFDNFREV